MQIVSTEDNLHGMSNPVKTICMKCQNLLSGKNEKEKHKKNKTKKKTTSKYYLLKILHRVLSLKTFNCLIV